MTHVLATMCAAVCANVTEHRGSAAYQVLQARSIHADKADMMTLGMGTDKEKKVCSPARRSSGHQVCQAQGVIWGLGYLGYWGSRGGRWWGCCLHVVRPSELE